MLDDHGNYSLEKLKFGDGAWVDFCEKGQGWEMLSWRMDVEEPGAALCISIALNKKNEACMKTGRTEIMNTLTDLCKPGPDSLDGGVPFEPLREKMVELYGPQSTQDFYQAFRLVMDAGGFSSPHMEDLRSFTAAHVNAKLRKMRLEAYGVVAPYPLAFPGLENACLKLAYRQAPTRGWCQLPPSTMHRLDRRSKTNTCQTMENVEECFVFLRKAASTVVEKMDLKANSIHRTKTKWIGEVDIGLAGKIFAVPRTEIDLNTSEQETELQKKCADFIALKLRELLDMSKKTVDDFPTFPMNELLALAKDRLLDPVTIRKFKEASQSQTSKEASAVAELLVPRIMEMDADGVPVSQHAVVEKPEVPMVIAWQPGVSGQVLAEELAMCKSAVIRVQRRDAEWESSLSDWGRGIGARGLFPGVGVCFCAVWYGLRLCG